MISISAPEHQPFTRLLPKKREIPQFQIRSNGRNDSPGEAGAGQRAIDRGHQWGKPIGLFEMSKLLGHQRQRSTSNAQFRIRVRHSVFGVERSMFSYTGTRNALRGAMVDRPLRGRCQKWRRSRNSISNALGARVPPSVL
jgi:hypothetical protein